MVTKTPKHVLKKIEGIVREIVDECPHDGMQFGPILVIAHEDPFGDESVYIYVVYDGKPGTLDPDWTVALPRKVVEQMSLDEIPTIPLKHFVHKSEWPKFYRYNVEPWILATS